MAPSLASVADRHRFDRMEFCTMSSSRLLVAAFVPTGSGRLVNPFSSGEGGTPLWS